MAMDFDESGERTFANNIPKKRVLSIQSHVVSGCKSIICEKSTETKMKKLITLAMSWLSFVCSFSKFRFVLYVDDSLHVISENM